MTALHFTAAEMQARRDAARARLAADHLDALLMFRQESMYYLTGYDTFGYCFFQCMVLHADGRLVLLTRAPDLRQARHTSDVPDIRVWQDAAGANPATDLRQLLDELGLRGARCGIEYDAYGLTAHNWRRIEAELAGFCTLEDASALVSEQRLVKSEAEVGYVRRAAELCDDALDAAAEHTRAGAFEGDILAAMHSAIFSGGGDYPGNEFIIGSGAGGLLCRYFSGRRHLDDNDQLTLEHAGAYRHYHAAMMRTAVVGAVHDEHRAMYAACLDALEACEAAVRPGEPMGGVFDAHAAALDRAGFGDHRMHACGYSLGTTFTPTWMDGYMFYAGNPTVMAENMVFFLHMILMNSDSGRAMTLGHTVLVTPTGSERLSRITPDLIHR